jgi:ABC-type sulfate/molybdate transport systems ATPase subunit
LVCFQKNKYSLSDFEKEWNILKEKKPSDLSGGMKKRVGVARALVGEPDYIFYDEPTTGLDPVTSRQIDQLIAHLSKKLKVTSLVITHDMFSVFEVADSVAMLDEGKVRFFGNPKELKESNDERVVEFLQDMFKFFVKLTVILNTVILYVLSILLFNKWLQPNVENNQLCTFLLLFRKGTLKTNYSSYYPHNKTNYYTQILVLIIGSIITNILSLTG